MAEINGTSGDDVLNGTTGADTINGLAGNDTINTNGGNDTVHGGDGDDNISAGNGIGIAELYGDDGNDTLTGSTGTGGQVRQYLYGGAGNDILNGSYGWYGQLEGGDGDDVLIGHSEIGDQLFGGNGVDRITGGNGRDELWGGAGADILDGGGGDDQIYFDGDTVDGGSGFDVVHFFSGNIAFDIDLTAYWSGGVITLGTGSIRNVEQFRFPQYLTDGDDRLIFGPAPNVSLNTGGAGGNDQISGGNWQDVITGGDGNDILRGLGGGDTLAGDDGADQLFGEAGSDVLYGGGGGDQLYGGDGNDELLGDGNLWTFGGVAGDDLLDGGAGDDKLAGGEGADQLLGGDGDDVMTGGGGNDSINGGAGSNDEARFAGNRADYQIVYLTVDGANYVRVTGVGGYAGDGADMVRDVEYLQFADIRLAVGVNPNNRPFLGQPAMDDQVVDDGVPYSYQIPATSFIDLDQDEVLTFRATLSNGAALPAWLTFNSATRTFSGTPPISAIGSVLTIRVYASDDDANDPDYEVSDDFVLTITQAAGADVLGTSGNDVLSGTFRNENMIGLDGDDVLNGSAGADRLDGQGGTDVVSYAASGAAVTVNLGAGTASGGDAQGDQLISIEGAIGSNFADLMTGTAGGDFLWGGGGDDVFHGGNGDDRILGEAGNDALNGDAHNDWLVGGAGIDTLIGGSGADVLFSAENSLGFLDGYQQYARSQLVLDTGAEADQLSGGDHSDVFFIGFNDSVDGGGQNSGIPNAGQLDGDALYVSLRGATSGVTANFTLNSVTLGTGTLTGFEYVNFVEGSDFDDVITMRSISQLYLWSAVYGMGGNDQLIAGSSTIEMYGGDGNDAIDARLSPNARILDGGAGNDNIQIQGLNGAPDIVGGAGFDTLLSYGNNFYIGSLSGIEVVEMVGDSTLVLSAAQVATGLSINAQIAGSGTINVMMNTPGIFVSKLFFFAGTGVAMNVFGSSGTDIFKLGNTNHTINAGDGSDQIKGGNAADTINGGNGIDKINGAGGADVLTGGAGNDVFKYAEMIDSGIGAAADRITDFVIGSDRLNFTQIDANVGIGGDQAFALVGTGVFTGGGAGSIRYQGSGADLLVQVDVDGNGTADMEIILQGLNGQTLTGGDFVL